MADFTVEGNLDDANIEPVKGKKKSRPKKESVKAETVRSAIKRWSNGNKELKKLFEENINEAYELANAERNRENQLIIETLNSWGIGDPKVKRIVHGKEEKAYSRDIYSFLRSTYDQIKDNSGSRDSSKLFYPAKGNEPPARMRLDEMGETLAVLSRGEVGTYAANDDQDWADKIFQFLEKNKTIPKKMLKTDDAVYETLYNMLGLDKYEEAKAPQKPVDISEMSIEEQSLVDTYGAKRRFKGQDLADWFESTLNEFKLNAQSGFDDLPQMDEEAMMYYQDVVNQLRGAKFSIDPAYLNPSLQEAYQGPEQEDIARNLEASLGIGLPPKEPPKPPTAVSPGDDEEDDDPHWAAFREQQERNRETSRKRAAEFNKLFESGSSDEEGIQYVPGSEKDYTEDPGIKYVDPPGIEYVDDPGIKFLEKNVKSLSESSEDAAKGIQAVNELFSKTGKIINELKDVLPYNAEPVPPSPEIIEAKLVARFLDKNQPSVEGIEPVNEPFTPKDLVSKAMGKKEDEEEDPIIAGVKNILRSSGRTGSKVAQVMDAYSSIKNLMSGGAAAGAGGAGGAGGGGVAAAAGGAAGGGAGGAAAAGATGMVPMLATGAVVAPLVMEAVRYLASTLSEFIANRVEFAKDLAVGSISDPSSVSPLSVSGEYFKTAADAIDLAGPWASIISEPIRQAVDFLESIDGGIQNLASDLAPFSPDIIAANVESQIAKLQAEMNQAQQLGPLLAENVRTRTEFDLAIRDLGTTLTQYFGPLINTLIELATILVKAADVAIPIFSEMFKGIVNAGQLGPILTPILQYIMSYLSVISDNTTPQRSPIQITELNDFLNPANSPLQGYMSGKGGRMQVIPGTLGTNF